MEERKARVREQAKQYHAQFKGRLDMEEYAGNTQARCEFCDKNVKPWEIRIVAASEKERWACQPCVDREGLTLSNSDQAIQFEAIRLATKWISIRG
ncbi:hypothetical protein [Laceyella tengchongensis]|jgi:hypothetical protein|uniref:Uncharacterized protein n=1 Tax=Laceyella tengchongensis TaxID=574699 RepID=A0AA45WRT5_9BACL|nr:hypothetical protein [Laceyella tengchongensis]MRG27968.1 hypothetical protein [Laceyella tengchongensis]SMP32541.1 hypothetical protein SAMN06265361_1099 [Laceyella tengchongensis]